MTISLETGISTLLTGIRFSTRNCCGMDMEYGNSLNWKNIIKGALKYHR